MAGATALKSIKHQLIAYVALGVRRWNCRCDNYGSSVGRIYLELLSSSHFGGLIVKQPLGHAGVIASFRNKLLITLVLFVCSNLLVLAFANIARWTLGAEYYGLSSFCRWDGNWFSTVAAQGYDAAPHPHPSHPGNDVTNWPFFPLHPLLARVFFAGLGISPKASVVVASRLAFLLAIFAFVHMAARETGDVTDVTIAGGMVAFNPYLIYANGGYSEPLYFALAAAGFYFLAKEEWEMAGLMGALLSATRIVGCLFAISYLISALRKISLREIVQGTRLDIVVGGLLCPLGLSLYMLYMYHHTGDSLAFLHGQLAWGRSPRSPWNTFMMSIQEHGWPRVCAVMSLCGLLMSAWLCVKRYWEMGAFLALNILIAMSASFEGFPRYIWWQPPLLFGVFLIIRRQMLPSIIYFVFAGAMASFMVVEWFMHLPFVI